MTLENWLKFSSQILFKTAPKTPLYRARRKLAIAAEKVKTALPVDRRSTGPTVIFLTVDAPVDCPVDRAQPVGRSPGRPAVPESGVLSIGRPPGRPAPPETWVVTVGRPPSRPAL